MRAFGRIIGKHEVEYLKLPRCPSSGRDLNRPPMLRCWGHEGDSGNPVHQPEAPTGVGKTTAHTDTYHGRFVELVLNKRVVEIDEFETEDPSLRGEMKITIELVEKDGCTEVVGVHEGLPPGLATAIMNLVGKARVFRDYAAARRLAEEANPGWSTIPTTKQSRFPCSHWILRHVWPRIANKAVSIRHLHTRQGRLV